jgi:hypothetical protein
MNRRAVLAGVAGSAGAALIPGCSAVLGEKPLQVRAMAADGDETDVRCELPAAVVEDHPALHDVLRIAATEREESDTGWVTRDVTRDRGEEIRAALEAACEETGGLYRWDGGWFFVSIHVK